MVEEIGEAAINKLQLKTSLNLTAKLEWIIPIIVLELVIRAFENSICNMRMSDYQSLDYIVADFKDGIERTE